MVGTGFRFRFMFRSKPKLKKSVQRCAVCGHPFHHMCAMPCMGCGTADGHDEPNTCGAAACCPAGDARTPAPLPQNVEVHERLFSTPVVSNTLAEDIIAGDKGLSALILTGYVIHDVRSVLVSVGRGDALHRCRQNTVSDRPRNVRDCLQFPTSSTARRTRRTQSHGLSS